MSLQDTVSSVSDLDIIVDADGHILETIDDLLPYMDDASRSIVERGQRFDYDAIYSRSAPAPPASTHYGDLERGDDPEKILSDMDEFDIDGIVLTPGRNQSINTVNNSRVATALASAFNEWVIETTSGYDRIKPTAVVAPQRPDLAAEQIDRHANEVAGVTLPIGGLVPPAGNAQYVPIYEAAATHDLPILLHGNSISGNRSRPVQTAWTETFIEHHTVVFPFQLMWNVTTLVCQGIPEQFPTLRFVGQEAGIGWIPYLTWRLDDHFYEYPDETPYLERRPSEYLEDSFFFTTQPLGRTSPERMARMIELVGPETIMYAADLPHFDFDPPAELFEILTGRFEDDVVRGIMGEHAGEVFSIEA